MNSDKPHRQENAWAARRAATAHRRMIRFNALAHALSQGHTPTNAAHHAGFPSLRRAQKQLRRHGEHGLADQLLTNARGDGPVTRNDTDMDRIEDFEFCVNTGEWPERAWRRANFTNENEARTVFEQHGRFDLARRLTPEPIVSFEDPIWV